MALRPPTLTTNLPTGQRSEAGADSVGAQQGEDGARRTSRSPIAEAALASEALPVYEDLEGWWEELDEIERFEDLPKAARSYIDRVSELVDVPIRNVSVGPDRRQTFALEA